MSNGLKVTRSLKVLCLLIAIFTFNPSTEAALFDDCDNTLNIKPGYSYLKSPDYPNSYPSGTSCRYKIVAPLDHVITVNCTINLDKAANGCSTEYFYLDRDGDLLLRDSEQFCGYRSFIRQTTFRTAVLAYVSNGSYGSFHCQLHAQPQACDCGWSDNTKIVNGQETSINQFPSIVALKDKTTYRPSYCGGTIISHYHILTTAHCARAQPDPNYIEALVGSHNLNSTSQYSAVYSISRIIEYPSYNDFTVNNDIAILVTSKPIEWSRGVGPICLPPELNGTNYFIGEYVNAVGWGTTISNGPTSPTLHNVELMVTDYKNCSQGYQGINPIYSTQICTYDSNSANEDSCQFDSGSPVILTKYRQFLLGITNVSKGCGQGSYAFNTRVNSFLHWIYPNTDYTTCNVSMQKNSD